MTTVNVAKADILEAITVFDIRYFVAPCVDFVAGAIVRAIHSGMTARAEIIEAVSDVTDCSPAIVQAFLDDLTVLMEGQPLWAQELDYTYSLEEAGRALLPD